MNCDMVEMPPKPTLIGTFTREQFGTAVEVEPGLIFHVPEQGPDIVAVHVYRGPAVFSGNEWNGDPPRYKVSFAPTDRL